MSCSLENLSLIKLEEGKYGESNKIKEFMEEYKINVENALDMVADDIISYCNSKLNKEEKYYKEPCTAIKPNSTLEEIQSAYETVLPNVPSCLSNVLLCGNARDLINVNKPASSFNNVYVMSNITQVNIF